MSFWSQVVVVVLAVWLSVVEVDATQVPWSHTSPVGQSGPQMTNPPQPVGTPPQV
jgi:hypothetical protein